MYEPHRKRKSTASLYTYEKKTTWTHAFRIFKDDDGDDEEKEKRTVMQTKMCKEMRERQKER